MAQLQPFCGLRYRPEQVAHLADVLCPPFDLLGGHDRYRYYLRHPYNAIRLELGQDDPGDDALRNRHTRAGSTLRGWLEAGVVRRDSLCGLYLYETEFRGRRRRGFVGLLRVDDAQVLSPERLEPERVEERLELLKGAGIDTSPVVGLFSDPDQLVTEILFEEMEAPPFVDLLDEFGDRHRLWRLLNSERLERIQEVVAAAPVALVDGHHRFEAARRYAALLNAHGADPLRGAHNFVLAVLVDQDEPGLLIEAMHRLVHLEGFPEDLLACLADRFELERFVLREDLPRPDQLESVLADFLGQGPGRVALLEREANQLVGLKPRRVLGVLDAVWLEREVLTGVLGLGEADLVDRQRVAYAHDPREALVGLGSGRFEAAFFVPPPEAPALVAVARSGQGLPPRAFQLVPPVPAGLVFHHLEGTL